MLTPDASVDTLRVASCTMRTSPEVVTKRLASSLLSASPSGRLKVALVPTPLVEPATPLPSSVLTSPTGVTARMRLL